MSEQQDENSGKKLKRTLRGRCEPDLVRRAQDFLERVDRNESYLVRKAVEEYLNRHEKDVESAPEHKAAA